MPTTHTVILRDPRTLEIDGINVGAPVDFVVNFPKTPPEVLPGDVHNHYAEVQFALESYIAGLIATHSEEKATLETAVRNAESTLTLLEREHERIQLINNAAGLYIAALKEQLVAANIVPIAPPQMEGQS